MNLDLVKWMDPLEDWMRCICNDAGVCLKHAHEVSCDGYNVDEYYV
jgi:hypothetical protein